jgi:hypothetical protein
MLPIYYESEGLPLYQLLFELSKSSLLAVTGKQGRAFMLGRYY